MNDFRWSQDQDPDSATGSPNADSVKRFGYVVHLLEDMGAPPHARADPHLCFLTPTLRGFFLQVIDSCDPFHLDNNGVSPGMPTGPPVIDTSGFTTPDQFFTSLQTWVQDFYYSDHTAFFPGMPGPAKRSEDLQYIYGDCIAGVSTSSTCVGGQRKIAHKGPLWYGLATTLCGPTPFGSCLLADFASGIDTTIAQEQYAEIGPVMVQQVAAFIQFYAPALNVQIQGSATATVASSQLVFPRGTPISGSFNCAAGSLPAPCSALFVQGTQITLTATPDPNSSDVFSGWGQDCSGTATTVTVTLTKDLTCVANFSPESTLTVQKAGSGTGVVTSSPAGINCGTACLIQSAPFNGSVQLTAVADPGYSFASWGGYCSGSSQTTTISITDSNESCIATFSPGGTLTITLSGAGTGTVTSSPAGIVCGASGSTCTSSFTGNVQLTANATAGSTFAGWGDACSGNGLTTTITVAGNVTCKGTFNSPVAVALNPYGTYDLSSQRGPYSVQVVNSSLAVVPSPGNISVTVDYYVDTCLGQLFPKTYTVSIPAGQQSAGLPGFVAGRPQGCGQATTVWTIVGASMNGAPLNLTAVPSQELSLSIVR